jgi:hypothetical protein
LRPLMSLYVTWTHELLHWLVTPHLSKMECFQLHQILHFASILLQFCLRLQQQIVSMQVLTGSSAATALPNWINAVSHESWNRSKISYNGRCRLYTFVLALQPCWVNKTG